MSKENVARVRQGYEAYQRGEPGAFANFSAELVVYRDEPDGATFHGLEGLIQATKEWVEDFDEFTMTAEEFIDANHHQVLVRVHQKASGARSGVPIDAEYWFVHTLQDSKTVRLDMLSSKAQAFRAAGLSE